MKYEDDRLVTFQFTVSTRCTINGLSSPLCGRFGRGTGGCTFFNMINVAGWHHEE